ncbi:MAG: hypothetical protein GWP08_10315 [Nitrospiraceae bacterium]|nr:hypothetical protein [Nitrospiraceae bacterium]
MIRVNLLPYHLRPIRRSPVPYILSAFVLVAAIAAMTAAFLTLQVQIGAARSQLAQHQEQYDALKDVVAEYNDLIDKKEALARKIETIQEIVSERLIWSRQLFNITRLTPDNFWYSGIAEREKSFREKRLVYNEKTKKEEEKNVRITRRVLELQGYVIEGADGSNDIYPLTLEMEQDVEFSSMFQLSLPKLVDTEFEGYAVRSFTLEYLIEPGAQEQ